MEPIGRPVRLTQVRSIETIDTELALLAAHARWTREAGEQPTTRLVDELLAERNSSMPAG